MLGRSLNIHLTIPGASVKPSSDASLSVWELSVIEKSSLSHTKIFSWSVWHNTSFHSPEFESKIAYFVIFYDLSSFKTGIVSLFFLADTAIEL